MTRYDKSMWMLLKESKTTKMTMMDLISRLRMLECIVRTLADLQKKNLCHLDIKPSNILLNVDGAKWNQKDLVLTDFGLSGTIATAVGSAGTPGFGSPEQFTGKVHRQSDNYSLGKLVIMLLFNWNTAWEILARPVSDDEFVTDTQGLEFISRLLNVSPKYTNIFFLFCFRSNQMGSLTYAYAYHVKAYFLE